VSANVLAAFSDSKPKRQQSVKISNLPPTEQEENSLNTVSFIDYEAPAFPVKNNHCIKAHLYYLLLGIDFIVKFLRQLGVKIKCSYLSRVQIATVLFINKLLL